MGRGATYCKWIERRIPYPDCKVDITARLMMAHIWHMYRTDPEPDWKRLTVSKEEKILQVFGIIFPKGTSQ